MKTRIALFAAAALALTGAGSAKAQDATVTFEFEVGAARGSVMVVLFSSGEGYNSNQPVAAMTVPVTGDTVTVTFDNLTPGSYGMKSFHDRNGNGEMDTNPFGMPIEPYAFSNNAVGNMGPASWDRARFNVTGPVVQTIQLR